MIRSIGTIFYSLVYCNSRLVFSGLKYLYPVISVIVDSLHANTKMWGLTSLWKAKMQFLASCASFQCQGPLDVSDRLPRLRAVNDWTNVLRCGKSASSRESSNGSSSVSLNKFLPHSLVTCPLSFLLSNPRNYFMDTYEISF